MTHPALVFGAATSDRVDVGSGASIVSLTTFTTFAWVFVTTLTAARCFLGFRYDSSGLSVLQWRLSGTAGDVEFRVSQTTTAADYITNDTPLATLNQWRCIAGTYDQAATPRIHLYVGRQDKAMVENGYGTSNNGSGNKTSETGGTVLWGNRYITSAVGATPIQGRMAQGIVFNRVLSLMEIEKLRRQFQPESYRPQQLGSGVNLLRFGRTGAGAQWDLSNYPNDGTVTGVTPHFGPMRFLTNRRLRSWAASPPAGGTVGQPYYYRHLAGGPSF